MWTGSTRIIFNWLNATFFFFFNILFVLHKTKPGKSSLFQFLINILKLILVWVSSLFITKDTNFQFIWRGTVLLIEMHDSNIIIKFIRDYYILVAFPIQTILRMFLELKKNYYNAIIENETVIYKRKIWGKKISILFKSIIKC